MTDSALMSGRLNRLIPILAFNVLYLLAAIIGSIASGNSELILYIVIMLVLGSVIWFADRRVRFSQPVLWGLSVWGVVHMAGGLIAVPESWPINGEHRVLYSLWLIPDLLKYDHVVHAFGFGVTTLGQIRCDDRPARNEVFFGRQKTTPRQSRSNSTEQRHDARSSFP
jgi:uncharacterized membrane protein YjdF